MPEIEAVHRVSPEQAMTRLRDGVGRRPSCSTESRRRCCRRQWSWISVAGARAELAPALAEQLEALPVVDEVAVTGAWAGRAHAMLDTLSELALGAARLVAFACMAIVWSTIRLGVYARRAEIQILRLVGGTAGFVRGPFVVEGMVQGALGAAAALTMLWVGFDALDRSSSRACRWCSRPGRCGFYSPWRWRSAWPSALWSGPRQPRRGGPLRGSLMRRTLAITLAVLLLPSLALAGRGDALEEMIEHELSLTRQAADLERAIDALGRAQAGTEYTIAILDHTGKESVRKLDAYRTSKGDRDVRVKARARAMYKLARGGVMRMALEPVDESGVSAADRVRRGRDLR